MYKMKILLSVSLIIVFLQPARAMVMPEEGENTPIWRGIRLFREKKFKEAAESLGPYAEKAPIAKPFCRELVKKGLLASFPTDDFLDRHSEQNLADHCFSADAELNKLKRKKDKQFARELNQNKNGALLCLVAQSYEEKDKEKATKLYQQAFKNGEPKGILELSRILDTQKQKITFLEENSDISVAYFKTLYNIYKDKSQDEGETFWKIAEKLKSRDLNEKVLPLAIKHLIYASALYGNPNAQYSHEKSLDEKQADSRLFWARFVAEQGDLTGLRASIFLFKDEKHNRNFQKRLEYIEKIEAHKKSDYTDHGLLAGFSTECQKKKQDKKWFKEALEGCSKEWLPKIGVFLGKINLHEEALPFFEKVGKDFLTPEQNMHYLLSFHLVNKEQPLSDEFSSWLHIVASNYNFDATVALSIFMAEGTIEPNIEKLLEYTESAYKKNEKNLRARRMYACVLKTTKKRSLEILSFYLSFPTSSPPDPESVAGCYYDLSYEEKDKEKARDWAQKGLEVYFPYLEKTDQKEINTELVLEMYRLMDKAYFKDEKRLRYLKLFAEKNIPEALCDLGEAYQEGSLGLNQNNQQAEDYYKRAYKNGIYKYNPALTYLLCLKMNQGDEDAFLSNCTLEERQFLSQGEYARVIQDYEERTETLRKTEETRLEEREHKNKTDADEAIQKLQTKKVVKQRQVNGSLNSCRKIIPVGVSHGKGSCLHVQINDNDITYHQSHGGAHSQTVDRAALKHLAGQLKEVLKKKESK